MTLQDITDIFFVTKIPNKIKGISISLTSEEAQVFIRDFQEQLSFSHIVSIKEIEYNYKKFLNGKEDLNILTALGGKINLKVEKL